MVSKGVTSVNVSFGIIMIMIYFFFLSGDTIEKKLGAKTPYGNSEN
jgi:hypothetical protein